MAPGHGGRAFTRRLVDGTHVDLGGQWIGPDQRNILGLVREYRLLADEAVWTMRSDRRAHPPYGVQGGKPGAPSWNVLNPGPAERVLPTLPMESRTPSAWQRLPKASEVYWAPWSE